MKRIGVTGASGFIGRALIAALVARGDAVRAFTRNPSAAVFPAGVDVRRLDLTSSDPASTVPMFDGLDAIVHLVGESVAGRWTEQKKREILDSRRVSTRNLVAALRICSVPPSALVCASGAGYYGSRGDEPLMDSTTPGADFLARVCIEWEREAMRAQEAGLRVVCLRQGIVLGPDGGALHAMLPLFRAGLGGPLGSGAQWWPWIHLDDNIALFMLAIDRDDCRGPLNAGSPDLATNARISYALGHALRRPSLAFAPGVALRTVLGEFAETLLSSQLMLPAKAQDLGFSWQHESLERALLDLLDPGGGRTPATRRFETSDTVAADPPKAFEFFASAANLERLTPTALGLRIVSPQPIECGRGAIIEYELKVRSLPVHWKTLIARWEPPRRFVDYQLRGPYLLWRHQHDFEEVRGGVRVLDTVDYLLPLAPLSNIAAPLVAADLRRIFEYRRTRLRELLG